MPGVARHPPFSPLHSEGGIGTRFLPAVSAAVASSFSPLHSEGGIGTPPARETGEQWLELSVLYIARVGLEQLLVDGEAYEPMGFQSST